MGGLAGSISGTVGAGSSIGAGGGAGRTGSGVSGIGAPKPLQRGTAFPAPRRPCLGRSTSVFRAVQQKWRFPMGYRVAVVGATGNVGREMLAILEELEFPVDEIYAVASRKSIGLEVNFADKRLYCLDIDKFDFS